MTRHRKWTPEEDGILAELRGLSVDLHTMAKAAGASYWQVWSRVQQLGLPKAEKAPANRSKARASLRGGWTEEEDALLRRYGTGLIPLEKVVAVHLPGRSRNAAAGRLRALGVQPVEPKPPTEKNLKVAIRLLQNGETDLMEVAVQSCLHIRDLQTITKDKVEK